MTDLAHTSPLFNKYYQDKRIRRYLITAGLINRYGDIITPSPEQVARARRVTQQQISDNYEREQERSRYANTQDQNGLSPKRSRTAKNKKDAKSPRRGTSRHLSSMRRSPISIDRKRSPKRAKSAHQRSRDSTKYAVPTSARMKSPIKDFCQVTMVYYGPQTNFNYDNCWFKPDGDEIAVSQQHCGGENLVVFKGHVKPNETFSFESRRHPHYPFGLALYINGLITTRISACCEYKHKRNVPLGGKHGLFGITSIRKGVPCASCQYRQRQTNSHSTNTSREFEPSNHRKSTARRRFSRKRSISPSMERTPTPPRKSIAPKRHSPELFRTPTPHSEEKHNKTPTRIRKSTSSSEEETKKPTVLSSQNLRTANYSSTQTRVPVSNNDDDDNDGDSYRSDFEESNDNNLPISNTRFDRPRISDSESIDNNHGDKKHSAKASESFGFFDDRNKNPKTAISPETKNRFDHSRKSPTSVPKKSLSSEAEDSNRASKTVTGKNHTLTSARKPPANIRKKSETSGDEDNNTSGHSEQSPLTNLRKPHFSEDSDNDRPAKTTSGTTNSFTHIRKPDSSDNDGNDNPRSLGRNNNFGQLRKPIAAIPRKSDSSQGEDNNYVLSTPKNNTVGHSKSSIRSEDEDVYYIPKTTPGRKKSTESLEDSLFDNSREPVSLPQHESQRELSEKNKNNRFLSTTTVDNDSKDQRPLSSSVHRKNNDTHHLMDTESNPRRISNSSLEDLFGDKRSSLKTKPTNVPASSNTAHETTKKPALDDMFKRNLDSAPGTESWVTDTNSELEHDWLKQDTDN